MQRSTEELDSVPVQPPRGVPNDPWNDLIRDVALDLQNLFHSFFCRPDLSSHQAGDSMRGVSSQHDSSCRRTPNLCG